MRSIFYSSRFHSKSLIIFSNSQCLSRAHTQRLKHGFTNLVQLQISSLNTNARIYLQDTPRDTMAKDPMFQSLCSTSTWNARGIMPNTSNSYLFMCSNASCSTQRFHNSCAPKLLSQHKHQILMCSKASRSTQTSNTHVLHRFSLNTKFKYSCASELTLTTDIYSIMCFRFHTKHMK